MTISLFSLSVHAKANGNCIFIQTAENGIVHQNSKSYQLTVTNADPWLIYFNQAPNKHLQSANFLAKNKFYQQMQQSFVAHNNHSFTTEIIGLQPNNTITHLYGFITKIKYNKNNDQISYQLSLAGKNLSSATTTPLKHVAILINGNDICINCGGPW